MNGKEIYEDHNRVENILQIFTDKLIAVCVQILDGFVSKPKKLNL